MTRIRDQGGSNTVEGCSLVWEVGETGKVEIVVEVSKRRVEELPGACGVANCRPDIIDREVLHRIDLSQLLRL